MFRTRVRLPPSPPIKSPVFKVQSTINTGLFLAQWILGG